MTLRSLVNRIACAIGYHQLRPACWYYTSRTLKVFRCQACEARFVVLVKDCKGFGTKMPLEEAEAMMNRDEFS